MSENLYFQHFGNFFSVVMSKCEWTKEKTQHLIFLWEGLPHLWDVSHAEYKNRLKRIASIEEIARQFNIDSTEIRRKFHNLRTQFYIELKKTRKKKSGSSEVYTSKWQFFEALQFIQSSSKCTETQSNLVSIIFYFNV